VTEDVRATAEAFARLAQELHEERGVTETVEVVLQFALKAVDCSQAGLALATGGGKFETAAVTDPMIEQADQLQSDGCSGPVGELLSAGQDFVLVADTTDDERWPEWASGVADLGLRTVLAVSLYAGGETFGALQLFSRKPFAFEIEDVAVAHILGRHASVAVASARQQASLWQAVDARKLIGQAQGILMERFDIDADRAFALLRRYSQDHNVKLREVARLLTENRRFPA
jgi:GAF domain-containing protein